MFFPISHIGNTLTFCGTSNIFCEWIFTSMGRSGLQIWQMPRVMGGLQVGCGGLCMV